MPHALPQVRGIGWDVLFSDKEFLFHQLTALFYFLFGEIGLRILPFVISAGTLAVLALRSFRRLPWQYALLPLLLLAAEPHFLRRFIMVRPQVLAVFCFTLLIYALLTRRKFVVGLAAALFIMSYHALQIPLIVFAAGLFTLTDAEGRRCLWALLAGLGVGILANPYFPGNLMIIPQIFEIVLGSHNRDLPYGGEIYPWVANHLLNYSLVVFLTGGFSIYLLGGAKLGSSRGDLEPGHKMLMILTGIFYAVTCMTPRGREYLVPSSIFLAIYALENRDKFLLTVRRLKIPLVAAMAAAAILQLVLVHGDYGFVLRPDPEVTAFNALEKIPESTKGLIVNCNWSDAPFIYYKRPNLSFLDILDPSFLYRDARPLHEARQDFIKGKFIDSYFSINNIFHAQYVLCDNPNTTERLDHDPRFLRLYPVTWGRMTAADRAVFRLKEEARRFFVDTFLYHIDRPEVKDWTQITSSLPVNRQGAVETSDFFDFIRQLDSRALQKDAIDPYCVYVKPSPEEIKAHGGAEYMGLGGGPNFRVWLNEKPLYESNDQPDTSAMIKTFVPLPHPLAANDEIKIYVCPPRTTAKYFGIALSFFKQKDIDSICEERASPHVIGNRNALPWAFKGETIKTCMANIAARR